MKTLPKPLITFDLANNHMGDMEHAIEIIKDMYYIKRHFTYPMAIKFQFRNLDTFIHPDYKEDFSYKYVKRFTSTRLDWDDFETLLTLAKSYGFLTEVTPFDEDSVAYAEKFHVDIIKIASCSFTDWPLLERIAKVDRPIIASTGGASEEDIDAVVSFFVHRNKELALMHCVPSYPTKPGHLELNQIDLFQRKYAGIRVGLSLHTQPDEFDSVALAVAKGVDLFEKHIGRGNNRKGYVLNAYSLTPDEAHVWICTIDAALNMCGQESGRMPMLVSELSDLHALRRGVWVKEDIPVGEKITKDNILLAIPTIKNQLTANDLSKHVDHTAIKYLHAGAPILKDKIMSVDNRELIKRITNQVRDIIVKSGILVPPRLDLEISHHYGLEKFYEYGCVLINFINRAYCKKLIIVLPGQTHPPQYHERKDETFNLLYGDLTVILDSHTLRVEPGETVDVNPGVVHEFGSEGGAIIEEISTTHFIDDSYYTDPAIMVNKSRKTGVTNWMEQE